MCISGVQLRLICFPFSSCCQAVSRLKKGDAGNVATPSERAPGCDCAGRVFICLDYVSFVVEGFVFFTPFGRQSTRSL